MRVFAIMLLVLGLSACADIDADLASAPEPLGDFRAGFLYAAAEEPKKLLISHDVSNDEWERELLRALEDRFRRYNGERLYHITVTVVSYSMPPPVVPGRSALQVVVNVWDDAKQEKLNEEPHSLYTIRVLESRLAQTTEERVRLLSKEVVVLVEDWLRDQHDTAGWFKPRPPSEAEIAASAAQTES